MLNNASLTCGLFCRCLVALGCWLGVLWLLVGCGDLIVCVLGGLWVWIVGIVLSLLVVLILVILFIVALV